MTANEIVREHFERKRRSGYSMRSLARDLGVSPTFVSNLFRSKKKVPIALVPKLARLLDIDSETVTEIRRLLLPQEILQGGVFKNPQATMDFMVSDRQSVSAIKQWFYIPIMELSCCIDYDGSPAYLARRLELSLPTVEVALRELCRAGLMQENEGKFFKTTNRLRMASAHSRSEIRNFHRQMLKKAGDELNNTDAAAFERRLITGITTTANAESIAIAKKMLSDAIHEIATFLSSADGDEVYQIAVQLFPLTKPS
jgi:transcriptional regulator with XRE-family HTH domain